MLCIKGEKVMQKHIFDFLLVINPLIEKGVLKPQELPEELAKVYQRYGEIRYNWFEGWSGEE
jgi:hypothetical protein